MARRSPVGSLRLSLVCPRQRPAWLSSRRQNQAATSSSTTMKSRPTSQARTRAGQHRGPFLFQQDAELRLVFRKRVLKPGSGIGYHVQQEDEIYYVLSGRGVMTLDGKPVEVVPGTAILTRTGSSHGLKQTGAEDLVIIINYEHESGFEAVRSGPSVRRSRTFGPSTLRTLYSFCLRHRPDHPVGLADDEQLARGVHGQPNVGPALP